MSAGLTGARTLIVVDFESVSSSKGMRGPQYGWFSGIITDGFFDGSPTFPTGPGQRRIDEGGSLRAHRAVFDLDAHRTGGGGLDRRARRPDREITALSRRRRTGPRPRLGREPARYPASGIARRSTGAQG